MELRKGMRITEMTRKVGQPPRHGKIKEIHGDSILVLWDDGHESSVSRISLLPEKRKIST
jgi:hypothetical protein